MRREGYIMEEVTDYGNMSEAFDAVLRGKKRKTCRQGRYLLEHRDEVIAELTAKLKNGRSSSVAIMSASSVNMVKNGICRYCR